MNESFVDKYLSREDICGTRIIQINDIQLHYIMTDIPLRDRMCKLQNCEAIHCAANYSLGENQKECSTHIIKLLSIYNYLINYSSKLLSSLFLLSYLFIWLIFKHIK